MYVYIYKYDIYIYVCVCPIIIPSSASSPSITTRWSPDTGWGGDLFVPEFPFLAMAPWESVPSAREVVAQLQALRVRRAPTARKMGEIFFDEDYDLFGYNDCYRYLHHHYIIIIICSLVGGLDHFLFFHSVGNNHPNWLSYFQRGWNHQPDDLSWICLILSHYFSDMFDLGEGHSGINIFGWIHITFDYAWARDTRWCPPPVGFYTIVTIDISTINPTGIGILHKPTYNWVAQNFQAQQLRLRPEGHAVSARPHLRTLGWPFLRLRGDWLGLEA